MMDTSHVATRAAGLVVDSRALVRGRSTTFLRQALSPIRQETATSMLAHHLTCWQSVDSHPCENRCQTDQAPDGVDFAMSPKPRNTVQVS
jgi:hypothetical protein